MTRIVMAAALAAACALAAGTARADFNVKTPDVNLGEFALETVGDAGYDSHRDRTGERSYTAEIEYGVTKWWQTEMEFEFGRDPGPDQTTYFQQITSENLFQLTQRGEYWLDVGFFAEYGQAMLKGDANETTFGPVLRKDFWGTSNSINLFFEKDIGHNAATGMQFLWAWETRVDAWQLHFGNKFTVEPGFQYYSEPGTIGRFAKWNDQDNRIGPQLFGKIYDIGPGTLEWNAGFLVGLTNAVPKITPRWQFEYEIHY
jgi:hypothetical protein